MADIKIRNRMPQALKEYQRATGKDLAYSINRALKNAIFFAIRETPRMKLSKLTKHNPLAKRKTYASRLFYALAAEEGFKKGQGIRNRANAKYKRRRSASGWLRAGWFATINDLGFRTRRKPIGGGKQSSAVKAIAKRLKATATNAITGQLTSGVYDEAARALESGIAKAAEDMIEFARRRMRKTGRKFSGKTR